MKVEQFAFYLDGTFCHSGNWFDITGPDGSLIGQAARAGLDDHKQALRSAVACKQAMKKLPSYKREEKLRFIADQLFAQRDAFATLIALEARKPLRHAMAETDRAIQTFRIAAEESKRLPKEYLSLDWTPAGEGREGLVKWFPTGVVAAISPFNFPLNLAVHKVAPALAAGCPVILKPASSTPLSCLKLARIIHAADFPPGAFAVLPMDRETADVMVTSDEYAMLSFTGSPEVGWKMKAKAGKKKVVLELGGNAAVIITPSANLKLAVERCLTGAFAYSGQVCIHAQRIFVCRELFEPFLKSFAEATRRLKRGNVLDASTEIGEMIDESNAERVNKWVQEALAAGASLVTGGKRDGSFYTPTILTGTSTDMKVCSEELFGPVVIVEPYDEFAQAIREVNNSRFGLQAGLFTNELEETDAAFNELEVGGVIINDVPTFRVDHMPYGGVKDSGSGREGVKYAIRDMMEPRILVK